MEILTPDLLYHTELVNALEKQGINFQETLFDESQVQLLLTQVYGLLKVEDIHSEVVSEIITQLDQYRTSPAEDSEIGSTTRPDYFKIGLIAYALLASAGIYYFWKRSQIDRFDPNFTISWNAQNTKLSYFNRKTGEISMRFYDEDFDGVYEQFEDFYPGKVPALIQYDHNADGYYEESYFYSTTGKYCGKSIDDDWDLIHEYSETILQNGDTLRLYDRNADGIMEWE